MNEGIKALFTMVLLGPLLACISVNSGPLDEEGGNGTPPDGEPPEMGFYDPPPMSVQQILLDENEVGNPRELRLFIPEVSGSYPLLQFQHGFTSDVDTYTDLLARLAGFGFVVVGPQMYVGDPSTAPSVADETLAAVDVLGWVQANLNSVLAERLLPELDVSVRTADTGLLGHSRGGQVAWRMLFDHAGTTNARAIGGIDPVDGDAPPFPPGETGEMVTDDPGAFSFAFPSLIIGMGLGATGVPGFECAPTNRNFTFFYDASAAPRFEVISDGHGHSDMLNGDQPEAVCPGATDGSRGDLRVFVAGQLAAYFASVLDARDELSWLRDLSNAPVATTARSEE